MRKLILITLFALLALTTFLYSNNENLDNLEVSSTADKVLPEVPKVTREKGAKIIRHLENSGSYKITYNRLSTAKGGYQITKGTLKFIFKLARRRGELKGVNIHNWTKHQDKIFSFYMKYLRSKADFIEKHTVLTDYLLWQTGIGKNGIRNYLDVLSYRKELKNSRIRIIKNNTSKKDLIKFERDNYMRAYGILIESGLDPQYYLRKFKNERMTLSTFRNWVKKRFPQQYLTEYNERKRDLLRAWINGIAIKINKIAKQVA